MACRSIRKRRHLRPYEEWNLVSASEYMVAALKAIDGRYPESYYQSSRQYGMTLAGCSWCKPGEDVCPRHPLTGNEVKAGGT